MSLIRTLSGPRRLALFAAGVCAICSLEMSAPRAQAAPPRYPDILPLSKVKPGMVGYGLTTFKGTTISRFKVTVIGILRQVNEGHDLILVRMSGGPITERHANLIEGMSGSPVYLNGKVAGAFSMGEKFPREPMGMVTPIEDMLEAWDPNIPQEPNYFQPANSPQQAAPKPGIRTSSLWQPVPRERIVALSHPIEVGGRRISRLVLNARPDDPLRSTADTAVLHPTTQMLSVVGTNEKDRAWLQKELDKRGYAVTVSDMSAGGRGHTPTFKGAPLRPGSAFGTWLATGDVEVGGTGTITYRRGNRVLAFGHPLFSLGALNAAISSAYILDIFPGLDVSHHIAVPGPIIGTLRQDRDFSISGEIGPMPKLIPFEVTVHDHTAQRSQTFHANLFQHPALTPLLLGLVARDAIGRVHDEPGDVMAKVTTTVEAGEVGKVTRTNLVFDSGEVATAATADLSALTDIISGNPFYPLPIKSANMTIDITGGHNTATIERIFLKQGKFAPGDDLQIGVELKPYRRDPIARTIDLKIPADTPSGRYALIVNGGTPTVTRMGPFIVTTSAPDTRTPPVNVRQMIARLNERERNTDMVARLVLNTAAPAIAGEKLSQLPPNLAMLMRSDRDSGVRLERDELRTVQATDYVVSGTQQLVVTVQRKDSQEPTNRGGFEGTPGVIRSNAPQLLQPGRNTADDGADASDDTPSEQGNDSGNQTTSALQFSPETQRWFDAVRDADEQTPSKPDNPAASKAGKKGTRAAGRKQGKAAAAPPAPATTTTTTTTTTVTTTTAGAASGSPDKPIIRPLQIWHQEARSDFAAGKFSNTSVTAAGELRLAPRLRRLVSSGETYVWSIAADPQGNLYAGTGTDGKILKVDPQGQVSTLAKLPVVSVQSLLLAKDGSLWAGSGIKGAVYHVRQDGEYTEVCTLPEGYILALAQDSKGNLYIGPGGGGTVYKLRTDGDMSKPIPAIQIKSLNNFTAIGGEANKPVPAVPYLKTPADHIMALALDAHDNLYVGTGNEGILYKVTPDGKSSVLYDAKENSITAIKVDAASNVYAGTGPKGLLYRIAPDGTAITVFDRATAFYTGLCAAPDGTLYAATVSTIYHIVPSTNAKTPDVVQPLDNPGDVDFLTLANLPDGGVVAGTGNVGEIYTSHPEANSSQRIEGTYTSPVHDAKEVSHWGALRLDVAGTSSTGLRAETRSGSVAEPDATWSAWTPVSLNGSGVTEGTISSPPARFIQFRLVLVGTANAAHTAQTGSHAEAAPAVRSVTISYLPRNNAPRVAFQSPAGGERWAKTQTIRWSVEDTDNDTITYDLYYSSDGVNWKPLVAGKSPASAPQETNGSSVAATLEDARRKLDSQSNVPDTIKQIILKSLQQRAETGNSGIGALRQPTKTWDTTTVPDGTYWLKVVASDRIGNPVDPQTAEAVSDPFVICNTPPTLGIASPPLISADRSVALQGSVSQMSIEITDVQYRVDGGDWIAAIPKDGLFDSPQEQFSLLTVPLASGKHTIEVVAFNAAGVKATQSVEVNIP